MFFVLGIIVVFMLILFNLSKVDGATFLMDLRTRKCMSIIKLNQKLC